MEQTAARQVLVVGVGVGALPPQLPVHGLGRPEEGHRHQGAGHPRHADADDGAAHGGDGGQVHRLAHHHRRDDVVLEVEVEHEEHAGDEPGGQSLGEGEQHEGHAGHQAADLGHEVEHGGPEGEQGGQRDAEEQAHHQHEQAVEDRHERRAGEVAADHAVEEAPQLVGSSPLGRRHEAPDAPDEALPVEQERHREQQGDEAGDHHVGGRGGGVLDGRGVAGEALGQVVDPALDLLGHVVVGEGPAHEGQVPELVDRARDVLLEVAPLADGLGTEHRTHHDDDEQQGEQHDAHRGSSSSPQALGDAAHDRIEGERQQRTDDQPREGARHRAQHRRPGDEREGRGGEGDDGAPVQLHEEQVARPRRRLSGFGHAGTVRNVAGSRGRPVPETGAKPSAADDGATPLLRLTTSSVVRAVLLLALAVVAALAFQAATRPLSWMLAALLLAGLLRPAVLRLSRHIPRGFAILIVALGSVALVGFVGYRGWDDLHRQVEFVEREAPRAARDLEDSDRYGELAREVELAEKVDTFLDDLPGTLQGGSGADALRSTATRGPVFFATFILMVFFLVSGDRSVRGGIEQIRDLDRRVVVERVVKGGYRRWWTYLSLVLARAVVVGLLTWATCRLLGIPAATVLGIWVAAWSLVPSVGIVVGSLAVVLLAIPESFTTPFVLLAAAVLVQVLDATLVQPRIDRRALHVGPFLTLLAAVLGLELYGIGGLVGAVAITILVVAFLDEVAPDDRSEVTDELAQLLPDDDAPVVDEVLADEERFERAGAEAEGAGSEGAGSAPTVDDS
ncbi:hypothetical protein B7486_51850 [cyanobacterium TDX16]|nr:hypothetical protein B7486_51850 [cyanobacterium TDX16]